MKLTLSISKSTLQYLTLSHKARANAFSHFEDDNSSRAMSLRGEVFSASNIAGAAESRRSRRFSSLINNRPHSKTAAVWRRLPMSRAREASSLAVMSLANGKTEELSHEPSRADHQLQFGGLTEDGLCYKEKFIVRCYEIGINRTATIQTIASYLQEVFCNHALTVGCSNDGLSTTASMREKHLIWVTSRMHIEVYKYPAWNHVVEIETWCQSEGRINVRRDSIVKDYATGEVIGRSTSKWFVMNKDTRRVQKLTDDVLDDVLKNSPKSLRLAFPEENKASMRKIEKLNDFAQYTKLGLVPRRADLDMNQHVNNVTYIGWILESIPQEIINSYEIQSLTLEYRRECQQYDVIDSLTSPETIPADELAVPEHEGFEGENGFLQFRHLLKLSRDGSEASRGRTVWRKKLQK